MLPHPIQQPIPMTGGWMLGVRLDAAEGSLAMEGAWPDTDIASDLASELGAWAVSKGWPLSKGLPLSNGRGNQQPVTIKAQCQAIQYCTINNHAYCCNLHKL